MRTLTLLSTLDGEAVHLESNEIVELLELGLKVRLYSSKRYSQYSHFVPVTPKNKAILLKAGFDFRTPVR